MQNGECLSLARFAGMRIPAEAFYLRWSDIDWNQDRILFRSPKTEHKPGHDETRNLSVSGASRATPRRIRPG
jgi:integrase